ncbi:MAG: N-acetyltransferase [Rhodospirillales bacterium]
MMAATVHIRPARPSDAEAIAEVHIEAWRSAYPGLVPTVVLVRLSKRAQTREWAQQIARRGYPAGVLVADLAGRGVIGFGSSGRARPTSLAWAAEIYTLYVLPEYQDCGIGRALLLGLFQGLADRGLTSALVWVLKDNPARFFYEAMGGRRVAERDEHLWNTIVPQAAYAWDDVRLLAERDRSDDV